MRLEMLQQIEQSLQQQQQQAPIETQTSPSPVAPALEAPSLTLKELPSPSTLPSPSPSPSPSASTSTPIEAAPPSPPAPIAENPATIEEPSPSPSAPIVETPADIEKPSLPPSLSTDPNSNPAEVVTTPNLPSPSEAPAQSSAAQSTDVEGGSNNVLGLIGVVGAALLGASFLQEKKQEPVANSPSDANATQSKEAVGPASTSGIESVEGNKLADD